MKATRVALAEHRDITDYSLRVSLLGAARYGVAPAPGALSVVQELLNTTSTGNLGLPDLLGDGNLASAWLCEVHQTVADGDSSMPHRSVTDAELRRLRVLRDTVAASVAGVRTPRLRVSVTLSMDESGRVDHLRPERPVPWIISTVMVETLLSQRRGDWRRLKICANPDCELSFFDRSRNCSGAWHDVRVCGNAINLRASRARRRS